MSNVKPIEAVNECVVKFANVNGSGSASANSMFAKSVFRMGVPIAPRNIFPSNIQGLPTWFEVRISEANHLARRDGVDLMVAMNAQTFADDVAAVSPGGYLLYDSTKLIADSLMRDDITTIGVPLTKLCLDTFGNIKARHMYKNILYLGALTALLDMDIEVVESVISENFASKPKLIQPNIDALHIGRDYVLQNLTTPVGLKIKKSDAVGDRVLLEGNAACALGAIYAGATVAGWYPITPSTSLVDAYASYCEKLRVDKDTGEKKFAIAQAEDELAAMGMVIGASWNGARAFTATSGPGVSLMAEFLGLAYFAEVPAVLFDVQRGGPSTGMPTRTQQSDILAAAYASHGDTKQVLIFPKDPGECFELSAEAFELAEKLQTPIIVLTDLDIGMNDWLVEPLAWDDSKKMDRGKVFTHDDLENMQERFGRYLDVDGDGIPYRTYPGTHPEKGAFFTRGTSRDRYAVYSEKSEVYVDNMQRLERKFDTAKEAVPAPEFSPSKEDTPFGIIYFGSSSVAMDEAMSILGGNNIHADLMRLRAFPFCDSVKQFIDDHEQVFVVEQNRDGQMRTLLLSELGVAADKLVASLHYGGMPITGADIADSIEDKIDMKLLDSNNTQKVEAN